MRFVASISHELRTPLAVLQSAADNLADGLIKGTESVRKYGSILQHQTRSMSDLVNEILLFAATGEGGQSDSLGPCAIEPVIATAVRSCENVLRSAGFHLEQRVDPGLPAVMGDAAGIAQCLRSLIGNAVKYGGSDRRILLCACSARVEQSSRQEVQISVTDRGIGIEPADLERVFEPFYRGQRAQDAQIHGSGLGLALARNIAESVGGSISVSSAVSAGSTFTLHLQTAKGETTAAGKEAGAVAVTPS